MAGCTKYYFGSVASSIDIAVCMQTCEHNLYLIFMVRLVSCNVRAIHYRWIFVLASSLDSDQGNDT